MQYWMSVESLVSEWQRTHQEDECLLTRAGLLHFVVAEAHADEDDGEDGEAHELDLLSAPRVDENEGQVVARDETADSEDDVADSDVVQSLVGVDGLRGAVSVGAKTDRGEDLGRVETEACMSAWTQRREAS